MRPPKYLGHYRDRYTFLRELELFIETEVDVSLAGDIAHMRRDWDRYEDWLDQEIRDLRSALEDADE